MKCPSVEYTSVESKVLAMAEKMVGLKAKGFRLPTGWSIYAEAITHGRAVYARDSLEKALEALPAHLPRPVVEAALRLARVELDHPVLYLPMAVEGRTVGLLSVWGEGLQESDLTAATVFAGQVTAALVNAQLFEQSRQRTAELEAINHISAALRTATTLDGMLTQLLDETLAVLGAEAGTIWLDGTGRDELRPVAARGWFTAITEAPMRSGEGIAGRVFAIGRPHVSREFARDPDTRESTRAQIPAGWGGACLPIRIQEAVIGVLFVSVRLPRELSAEEVRLLETLAEMAGNAFHRMRLHEKTEARLRQLQALHAIDLGISGSLDLRVTLGVLLEQTLQQLGVGAAEVLMLNPAGELEYTAGTGFRWRHFEHTRLRLGQPLAGQTALNRQPLRVDHLPAAVDGLRASGANVEAFASAVRAEGFVWYAAMPLLAKGRVLGVLEVFQRQPFDPDDDWLDFLKTLAGQAAIAIDNAALFEDLQRSNAELAAAYDATIEGWSRALDLRDRETEGHTRRVTELTLRLARAMGLGEAELVHLRRGALLHDIGKMGVPDAILHKPGPLTEAEWAVMRRHP